MPRPLSWLPRLPEIRRAVQHSARSHYGRRDLERLFELQPRAALKLLELLPTVPIGTSHLVERDALLALLEAIDQSEEPASVLAQARDRAAAAASRRTLRQFVAHDHPPATWETLPASLTLETGRLRIDFTNVEEVATALVALASLLEADLEEFARRYEVRPPEPPPEDQQVMRQLWEELQTMEALHRQ